VLRQCGYPTSDKLALNQPHPGGAIFNNPGRPLLLSAAGPRYTAMIASLEQLPRPEMKPESVLLQGQQGFFPRRESSCMLPGVLHQAHPGTILVALQSYLSHQSHRSSWHPED
jgi:hypothetical protein